MKSSIIKFGAALALAVPLVASANGSFTDSQTGDDVVFSGHAKHKGVFDDSFTFDVASGDADAVLNLAILDGKKTGVKDVTVALYEGSTLIDGDVTVQITKLGKHTHFEFLTDSFGELSAGVYTVDIFGKFEKHGGDFLGGVNLVSAVPEPGTWAAMVLGLLLMGYIAKRRSRSL